MQKRFIAKNNKKHTAFKIILWVIVIYLSFVASFNLLLKASLSKIIGDGDKQIKILNFGLNRTTFSSENIFNPENFFKLSLNYMLDVDETLKHEGDLLVIDKDENDKNPKIYIYNTHQTESYDSSLLEAYNISYTVETASYILRDYLKEYSIPCFVETSSISDYLKNNGLLYKNSYDASRYYASKRLEENPSIEFLIDLHRDSATAKTTKVNIDGKNYAKIMFVVGLDHPNYQKNLDLATNLNNRLKPELSRGISEKTGTNVNGIYNQDLSPNSILIEVGGVDNTIDEVNNSLKIIAEILFKYLNGE